MQEGKQILKTGETPVLNVPNHGLIIINESGLLLREGVSEILTPLAGA